MKNLIVYVYTELFDEEITSDGWRLAKAQHGGFDEGLTQEFISYWKGRLNQEPSHRGVSLNLVTIAPGGTLTSENIYHEMQPAKKKVLINPVATEKNKGARKKNPISLDGFATIQGGNTFIDWSAVPVSPMGAQEVENN